MAIAQNDQIIKRYSLAMDLETELIGAGRLAPRVACVTFYSLFLEDIDRHGRKDRIDNPADAVKFFKSWVELETGFLIGHNIAFDMLCLARFDPTCVNHIYHLYEQGRVWDTGIHERLSCLARGWTQHPSIGKPIISGGVSLAQLTKGLVGVNVDQVKFDPNSPRYHYGRLIGVDVKEWSREARAYALDDARYTYQVFIHQFDVLKQDALARRVNTESFTINDLNYNVICSFALQVRSAWALHHLSAWGLRSSSKKVKAWKQELEQTKKDLLKEPIRAGIIKDGKKNMKLLRELIEKDLKEETPKTEKGSVSTSNEVLKLCFHPALKALSKVASCEKLLNTFSRTLERSAKEPLCPRWNVLVRSGRTSCTNPNLQQLPQKGGVRECFTPRKGYVYVGADYSTAELCALAQVCLNWGIPSKMGESIRAGKDLHLELACSMMNITYEEGIELKKNQDPQILKLRKLAKVPNFGLPGGLSAEGLVSYAKGSNIDISLDESKKLKKLWFETWTEMKAYFENVSQAVNRGYAIQHTSNRRRGNIGFTDGANTYFQGLIADGAKTALYDVVKACFTNESSALYGSRPVLFIHDEIILESPRDKAIEAGDELARIMVESMKPYLLDVPIQAEPWVSERWHKGLETQRDKEGRLIIQK